MASAITVLDPAHMLDDQKTDMWVQEAIYGHRFSTEQKPFMLVLEALAVCRGRSLAGLEMFPGLDDDKHEVLPSYIIAQRALRFLIFWRALDGAVADPNAPPARRLDDMIAKLELDYPKGGTLVRFDYLRERTREDPDALLQAIEIVRGSEVNPDNNKRAQSRFLNPQGPALHLTELNNKMTSSDRRFFSRGGELVYLMLNRSKHRTELAAAIEDRLLEEGDPIDKIAQQLMPKDRDEREASARLGYLPGAWMAAYDRLAEDWLSILSRKSLPRSQLLGPLSSITALNMVRYYAEVGQSRFNVLAKSIPLDMSDGALKDIRSLGKMMLTQHQEAIRRTTRKFIDDTLEDDDEWQACIHRPHPDEAMQSANARSALESAFRTEFKDGQNQRKTREGWLDHMIEKSRSRNHGDPATVVQPLATNAGFASTRQRVGTWFAGSDAFLEALVHTNVGETPVELEVFTARLFGRYGIVIGPAEAAEHLDGISVNTASFRRNFLHLEERLASLGLLKRLSDDCAFVLNPFAEVRQ